MVAHEVTGRPLPADQSDRIPPGQHLVESFPVLTAGGTTRISVGEWSVS